MSRSRAALARRITWRESKQSYFTMRLLVDRDLVDDSFRAYAYFRWADDVVDEALTSKEERLAFIRGQKALIEALYAGQRPVGLREEEALLADLIAHDRGPRSRLRSYIENFLAIIEFDAERRGRLVSDAELRDYTERLALAVTDAIQYFIANGQPVPEDEGRLAGARAAHIAHMLRDMRKDLAAGYTNIPTEVLGGRGIGPEDLESPAVREWVRVRVEAARDDFRRGKAYIDRLDVLRAKVAARWYCARFENILDAVEADGYRLLVDYAERHRALGYLRMAGIAVRVVFRHARDRVGKAGRAPEAPADRDVGSREASGRSRGRASGPDT